MKERSAEGAVEGTTRSGEGVVGAPGGATESGEGVNAAREACEENVSAGGEKSRDCMAGPEGAPTGAQPANTEATTRAAAATNIDP